MKRYIGIDLYTDSFTACILQEGEVEQSQTPRLQNGSLERFIETLRHDDEFAVEANDKIRAVPQVHACTCEGYCNGTVLSDPRSTKKTGKNDARTIALFLSKGMSPKVRLRDGVHAELASLIVVRT